MVEVLALVVVTVKDAFPDPPAYSTLSHVASFVIVQFVFETRFKFHVAPDIDANVTL